MRIQLCCAGESSRRISRWAKQGVPVLGGCIGSNLESVSGSILSNFRPLCFLVQTDSNRDNILTREEIEQALANQELILGDDQLTHLMAVFDLHGRGYVTLGDFHDSLKTFRARQQRAQVSRQMMASTYPQMIIQQQPISLPDSSSVTRLPSALLAPLVLFTKPVSVEGLGKRQRFMTKAAKKRMLEQEAGICYLDITDPEIGSLVDYLMGVGNGDDSEEEFGRAKGELPSNHTDHSPSAGDGDQSKLRPLSLVMSALESAASRSPYSSNPYGGHIESVRGPGAAAVPSSAARVVRILRILQKLWHRTDGRRRENGLSHCMQWGPDEFNDEKLSAAVGLFEVDERGHIALEDVMTVFRNVRVGKVTRRRPPSAALSSLGALGRYLENRKITAHDFIQEAAMSAVTIVDPVESCGQSEEYKPTPNGKQVADRNQTQPATTAQLETLLCSGVHLSAQQRTFILECVEESGFVSGASLACAVQQARGELAHLKLARFERRRGMGGGGGGRKSRATESQVWDTTAAGSNCDITSPPRYRQQAKAAAAEEAGTICPPQNKHQCRRSAPPQQDVFNQSDASLVLDFFVKEGGGLRSLTGEMAAALWRGLKRRGRGLHAYDAGRSASRRLCQLLLVRGLTPVQWFTTLDATMNSPAAGCKGVSVVAHRIPTSSIIHGVRVLVEMVTANPLGKVNTVAASAAAANDDDSATTSVEGGHSDGTIDKKLGNVGKGKKWTKARLSALVCHLDPCGEGSITQVALQEGLSDCHTGQAVYPDAVQLAAARRFEAALQDLGCRDVCGLLQTLVGRGRGGGEFFEYVRQVGNCARGAPHGLDAGARQEQAGQTIAMRERVSTYKLASGIYDQRFYILLGHL